MTKKLILFALPLIIIQSAHAGLKPSSPFTKILSCHIGSQYFESSDGYQIDFNNSSLSEVKFKGTSDIVGGDPQEAVILEESDQLKIKTSDDRIKILVNLNSQEHQFGQHGSDIIGQVLGQSSGRHIYIYKGRLRKIKTFLGIELSTKESDVVCTYM